VRKSDRSRLRRSITGTQMRRDFKTERVPD
jgi:hypothetical protein